MSDRFAKRVKIVFEKTGLADDRTFVGLLGSLGPLVNRRENGYLFSSHRMGEDPPSILVANGLNDAQKKALAERNIKWQVSDTVRDIVYSGSDKHANNFVNAFSAAADGIKEQHAFYESEWHDGVTNGIITIEGEPTEAQVTCLTRSGLQWTVR